MQIKMLNASWVAPVKPYPIPLPVAAANFAPLAVNGIPPIFPSAIPGFAYAPTPVATSSFLWDAITVGYGTMPNIGALAGPAHASGLRNFAAARANLSGQHIHFPLERAPGYVRTILRLRLPKSA